MIEIQVSGKAEFIDDQKLQAGSQPSWGTTALATRSEGPTAKNSTVATKPEGPQDLQL